MKSKNGDNTYFKNYDKYERAINKTATSRIFKTIGKITMNTHVKLYNLLFCN